jgi:hypothetical protein
MKTLMAAVALATVFAAPAFAQSVSAWGWKGAVAAPASAKSAYAAASFNGRRGALTGRRGAPAGLTYARNCNISPASPSYRTNCN